MMSFDQFIAHVRRDYGYAGQVAHIETLPAQEAKFVADDYALHPAISDALKQQGIDRLYTHQADALTALRRQEDVVVVTATASGKTLCYQIPTLEALLSDPQATALYLFPTKALSQDQARGLARFGELNEKLKFSLGTYDGDTPSNQRKTLRE
ncbi:MAG: DEAD/DEAH box helicase, partial [Gemmatimonadota bacterium]|nr:DEAD/DEAH box helicase [Gemmatimonadota bacterium]